MPDLKRLLLILVLLCLTAGPAFADRGFFYKGGYGMNPGEIEALWNTPPEVSERQGFSVRLEYPVIIAGQPGRVTYNFQKTGIIYYKTLLYSVQCQVDLDAIPLADCTAFAAELVSHLQTPPAAFDFDYFGKIKDSSTENERWQFEGSFLNDREAIYISGMYNRLMKRMFLNFFYNFTPMLKQYHHETLERISQLRAQNDE